MWSSIKSIVTPQTLYEAYRLNLAQGTKLFSGGSYTVREKDPAVHTLIDINHLLNKKITIENDSLTVDAGVTLQNILDSGPAELFDGWLGKAVRWSCSSKNIRHQRTIGGETARQRVNSEIWLLMLLLNPDIQFVSTKENETPLRLWDGNGVVTRLHFNLNFKYEIILERFAVLPSAPAHLIVGALKSVKYRDLIVGGKVNGVFLAENILPDVDIRTVSTLATDAAHHFIHDQYGSIEYKKYLIQTRLKRFREQLWR